MATREEHLARLERTADDLAAAIHGVPSERMGARPRARSWSATEVVCHLRDTEELFQTGFASILGSDAPSLHPGEPDRWAEERQYLRNDPAQALAAFRRRRTETLALLRHLQPAHWDRVGVHAARGRQTMRELVGLVAAHDDVHLDQLRRALLGNA